MTDRRPLLILTTAAFAAAAFVIGANAQTPVPAGASAANVPKPSCQKPGDVPSPGLASDNQRRAWQKDYTAWGECMKKFITEQQAAAEPYNKAANAAIDDYNSTVKMLNEQVEKLKDAAK
jgi:hypothetical protein